MLKQRSALQFSMLIVHALVLASSALALSSFCNQPGGLTLGRNNESEGLSMAGVCRVTWNARTDRVAMVFTNGDIKFLNLVSNKATMVAAPLPLAEWETGGGDFEAYWQPDGKLRVLKGREATVTIDPSTLAVTPKASLGGWADRTQMSPDCKYMIKLGDGDHLGVWDLDHSKLVFEQGSFAEGKGGRNRFGSACWSPDSQKFVLSGPGPTITVREASRNRVCSSFVCPLKFSTDRVYWCNNNVIWVSGRGASSKGARVSGEAETICLKLRLGNKLVQESKIMPPPAIAKEGRLYGGWWDRQCLVEPMGQGKGMVIVSAEKGQLFFWNSLDQKVIVKSEPEVSFNPTFSLSPDGRFLALHRSVLNIFHTRTGSRILRKDEPAVVFLEWSADSTRLLAMRSDGSFKVYVLSSSKG